MGLRISNKSKIDKIIKKKVYGFGVNEKGSVAVIVVLLMPVIFLFIALTFDIGQLAISKNRYQHIADAAVLAGIKHIAESPDNVFDAMYSIISENNADFEILNFEIGYYDENDIYKDFPAYKEFALDSEGEIPEGIYPNALLMEGVEDVATLAIKQDSQNTGQVGIQTIVYLKRYGLIALGEDGIKVENKWGDGYPQFINCSLFSEGNIDFNGGESFIDDVQINAVGTIFNGKSGAENVMSLNIPPLDWEKLRQKADKTYYPEDWDIYDHGPDEYGNRFVKFNNKYYFLPQSGDHNSRKYYFAFKYPEEHIPVDMKLYINLIRFDDIEDQVSFNFSILCEGNIYIKPESNLNEYLEFGKPEIGIVYIYTAGDLIFQDRYRANKPTFMSNGVVFRAEGRCSIIAECGDIQQPARHKMRIIANDIIFNPESWRAENKIIIDGMFGTPYPPVIPKFVESPKNPD